MHLLKRTWIQFGVVILIGSTAGLRWKRHRTAEAKWQATHYRLDEKAELPLLHGVSFERQFFLDESGQRHVVPLGEGLVADWDEVASWWSLDGDGRMHFFDEDRVEVYPNAIGRAGSGGSTP